MSKETAKTRWLSRARTIAAQIERYASFGFVTEFSAYSKDDAAILKAIDRLYDSQRKEGLSEDAELNRIRGELRQSWSTARNVQAPAARASYYEGAAGARARVPEGMQGYLDELKLSRAKGKL